MKKKVIILGSTGSIGEITFNIFKKDNKNFNVVLLSTNSNVKKIMKQAKELNVKNIIINDKKNFLKAKKKYSNNKINIFNDFEIINKIFKPKEIYYTMISIVGLDGLKPAIILPKYTNNLAIVNKESIICGWNLIKKKLNKFNTHFLPIDSEHYSIFTLLKNYSNKDVEKIYITASGGPFLNYPLNKFKFIKTHNALKHPNWKMGKKITIDSSTLMNKVFEVIEAKKLFNIPYNKISILTHPNSYIHAIIKFKNGIIKILAHDVDMKIPVFNSIYSKKIENIQSKSLDINVLNKLQLKKVNTNKFPLIKIINKLPEHDTLFETILITVNDYLVYKFLDKKINFNELMNLIIKFVNLKEFLKYKKIKPKHINDIYKLRDYVSLKLSRISI